MRVAKAPVAIGLAAALILGGGIAALADKDSSSKGRGGAPRAALPAQTATAPSGGEPSASPPGASSQCGAASTQAQAKVDGQVAERIYSGELSGAETRADRVQIATYGPLLRALRGRNRGAVHTAVNELVYSHTHIVRLRVSSGGRLWADIGGPYILAPASGTLRSGGRTIGRFVFSVQDDLGYIKLVTRFIGVPLVLRTSSGQVPVPGQASPGSLRIPDRGPVSFAGHRYEAYSFAAAAYPEGRLRVSLFVPGSARHGVSCAQVRADETARIAQRIARRFSLSPSVIATYETFVHTLTLGVLYIQLGGHVYLSGIDRLPHRLPSSGAVTLAGHRYRVSSFKLPTSAGPARAAMLVPAS